MIDKEKEIPFQVPGSVSKVTSMSRGTVRVQYDTFENISPEAMKRLFELIDQPCWLSVNVHQIEAEDIVNLPPLRDFDQKKSPSERLRNVLFVIWQRDNGGHKAFDNYYIYMMERLIEHYKQRLS